MANNLVKKKSVRVLCVVGAVLVFAGVLVYNAVRDIGLKEEIAKLVVSNLPEISMANVNFEKEIQGVRFKLNAASADRRGGVVNMASFDASWESEKGDLSKIHSTRAVYVESANIVELPEGGKITWVVSGE